MWIRYQTTERKIKAHLNTEATTNMIVLFTMSLNFFIIILCIQTPFGFYFAAASSSLNTFRSVQFLPDWTNSVYKTQPIGRSSLTNCAANCVKELDEKCGFFFADSRNCFLGNLTLNTSGLAPLIPPKTLLINESKTYLCFLHFNT